jgi:hypothetical protein
MRKRNPWLMVIVALCFLGLAQLACNGDDPPPDPEPDETVTLPDAVRGGGWVPSESGEGKATFGFQLTCDKETGDVEGQFQYNDHTAGVAFHGVVQYDLPGCIVQGTDDTDFVYKGHYTPQPKHGDPGGDFEIRLDEQGCLTVDPLNGIYGSYDHSACLEGGNIRIWGWQE